MIGFEEDYEEIDQEGRGEYASYLSFGEWIFFAFSMEPNSEVARAMGKLVPNSLKALCYKGKNENEILRNFAKELLEIGEVIFNMSEKYRKISNGGHT